MKLIDLDKNCISKIFLNLDLKSISCFSRCFKRLNEIGKSDFVWKALYIIHNGEQSIEENICFTLMSCSYNLAEAPPPNTSVIKSVA